MERLQEVFRNIARAEIPFRARDNDLCEIQALINEINGVELEIEKIGISYLFDEEKSRIRNALKTKRDNLLSELEQKAKNETSEF
jgi:hypothetical protein